MGDRLSQACVHGVDHLRRAGLRDVRGEVEFAFPANVPQPGTSDVIDSSDTRLTQAVAHADPAAGGARGGLDAAHRRRRRAGARSCAGTSCCRRRSPSASWARSRSRASSSSTGRSRPRTTAPPRRSTTTPVARPQLVDIRAQSRVGSTALGQMAGEVVLGTSSAIDQDFTCGAPTPLPLGRLRGRESRPAQRAGVWGSNQLNGPHTSDPAWLTRNFALTDCRSPATRARRARRRCASRWCPAFTACSCAEPHARRAARVPVLRAAGQASSLPDGRHPRRQRRARERDRLRAARRRPRRPSDAGRRGRRDAERILDRRAPARRARRLHRPAPGARLRCRSPTAARVRPATSRPRCRRSTSASRSPARPPRSTTVGCLRRQHDRGRAHAGHRAETSAHDLAARRRSSCSTAARTASRRPPQQHAVRDPGRLRPLSRCDGCPPPLDRDRLARPHAVARRPARADLEHAVGGTARAVEGQAAARHRHVTLDAVTRPRSIQTMSIGNRMPFIQKARGARSGRRTACRARRASAGRPESPASRDAASSATSARTTVPPTRTGDGGAWSTATSPQPRAAAAASDAISAIARRCGIARDYRGR